MQRNQTEIKWRIEQLRLDLKYTWKISRNASDFKINFIVTTEDEKASGRGEVAPNIRYHETPENILEGFEKFVSSDAENVKSIDDLTALLNNLDLPNALRFGIESAYIHFICNRDGKDIYSFLGINKPLPKTTSYSLPIMETGRIAEFFIENRLERFHYLKVKINAENAIDMLKEVNRLSQAPLIVDANEAWKDPDQLMIFMEQLKPFHIALIEQPFPDGMIQEYCYVKERSPYTLMADESICSDVDFDLLQRQFHGVNMKLMKAGGYLNGLRILCEAGKRNMRLMIGCMVETTIGIASALHLCDMAEFVDLDGFLLIKEEPFALVRESEGKLFLTD